MEDRSSCIRDLHVACGHPAPPKSETVSYFAVFDGHLGDATAEFLEKNMYAFFFDALREVESYGLAANDRELLAAAMQRAFELAEARVHDLAKRTVQQQTPSVVPASACEAQINYTSGSTACVLAIRGNCITIANLGDSRCILSRGGRPHTITLDHRLLDPATVRLSSSSSSPTACADDSTSAPYLASKRITDASPATCRRCDRPCAKVGRIPRAIPRLLHSSPSTSVHVPQVFPSSATDPRPPHRGNEAGGSAGQHAGQNQQGTGLVHGQHQHHQRAAQLHTKRDGLQHLHERYSSSSSSSSSSSAAVSAATTSIQSPQQNILAATTSDTNSSSSFSAVSPPPPPPLHFYSGGRNSSHFPSSGLPASAPPRLTPPSASPPAPSSSFSSPSASPIAPLHHPDTRPRLHSQNPPSSSSSSSSPSEHHRLHQDKESSQFVPRHHHLYSHSHDNPAPLVQLLASGTASSRRNSGGTNPGGRGGDSYLSIPDDSRSADDNSEQHRHERDSGASASAASMPLVQKLPLDDNEAVALECREAVEATSNLPPRPPSSLSTTSFPFGDLNFASSSSSAIHQHLSTPNEEPTVPVGEKAAECRKFELPAVTTDCANVGASADIEKIATGSPSETVEDTAGNGGSVNTAGKKKEGVSCRRAGDKAPNAEAQSQMSSGGAPSGVRIRKIGEEKKGKRGVPPAGRRSTRRRRGASNVGSEKDVVKGAAAIREINRRVMAEVTRLTPPILTELERITEDEQKVQACREYLRVTESTKGHVDAKYLNGVLSVSRAIGDYNKLKFGKLEGLSAVPDIYQLFLRPEDEFLVLTCDGVTDVLSESDIVKCVRNELMKKGKNPRDAAQKLIKRAMLSPTENVTAVVVAISQDESDLKTSSTAGSCQNVAVHDPWNADSRSRVFVNGSAVAPPAVAAQPKAPNRVRKKITYPTADALMADC